MKITLLISVAIGGAVGALGRFFVTSLIGRLAGPGFPWGTLAVNILGSLVMGVLIETMALRWSVSQEVRALLVIGVLGAFTTFSSFSLDVYTLVERGESAMGWTYVLASVLFSVGALFLGLFGTRAVLT